MTLFEQSEKGAFMTDPRELQEELDKLRNQRIDNQRMRDPINFMKSELVAAQEEIKRLRNAIDTALLFLKEMRRTGGSMVKHHPKLEVEFILEKALTPPEKEEKI